MAAILPGLGWVTALDVVIVAVLVFLCGIILGTQKTRIPKGLRLPPGPPGKSILGNVSDVPTTYDDWKKYSQWADKYGDLICLQTLGKRIMIVNSADVAHDLFEKASANYSDRSDMPMIRDLMGFDDWGMGFMKYGERWRQHRRMFNKGFHPAATAKYWDLQMRQTRKMLKRMLESPEDFVEHLHHTAGAMITEAVYGFEVLPKNDPYLDLASKVLDSIVIASSPGKYLVDIIPILKYVPEWIPGAGFRKQARIWREMAVEMRVAPFSKVKKQIAAGTAKPSLTASLLEEVSHNDNRTDEEEVICNAVAVAYLAGATSTAVVLHIFILAMILHPEAQQKAQAELHNVIGDHRLPEFQDREKLPYINALCKEIIRWKPSTPFGLPHTNSQDGVYRGYFIPKGSILIGNAVRMLHDEATFGPEPEKFIPERFLVPGVKDPNVAFGFGRRICPGKYFFENLLFISIACILQVFDIKHAKDMSGREIPVENRFIKGMIGCPEPFQCAIIPRSEQARQLIDVADDE